MMSVGEISRAPSLSMVKSPTNNVRDSYCVPSYLGSPSLMSHELAEGVLSEQAGVE